MCSDRGLLKGLELITGAELRYFELVSLRHHGSAEDENQQCYFCVGKHAFFTVRPNLSGLYMGEAGKVYLAHVERIVEDTQSDGHLLIIMTSNRPNDWESERLFLVCHNRTLLGQHLAVAWQTDRMWRLGEVAPLPWTKHPLQKKLSAESLCVHPYEGWKQESYQGYSFFIQKGYKASSSPLQASRAIGFVDETTGRELSVQVVESEALSQVREGGREHIRWVAMERRQAILEPFQYVYILRNSFYVKRMNLSNDIAAWTAWEFLYKVESEVTAVLLLRRDYIPPVLDLSQDIIITLRCPSNVISSDELTNFDLLKEIHIVADSMSPLVENCVAQQPLYFSFIQAKLNALHFDEEAMSWIYRRLRLEPVHKAEVLVFMKAVLRLLQDENALNNPSLLDDLDSVEIAELMTIPRKFQQWAKTEMHDLDEDDLNAWMARVARYLAYQLDGVACGPAFTLIDLVTVHMISEYGRSSLTKLIYFLLHLRPPDMSIPYYNGNGAGSHMTLQDVLLINDPNGCIFNDRVMQGLLESGWIKKALGKGAHHHQQQQQQPSMSNDYAKLLSLLLMSNTASRNLKVSACREIIAASQGSIPVGWLIPALVELMERGNLFLQTYATVTLINVTSGHTEAKALLMTFDAARICCQQLQTKDDDLLYYTLVLLTNITKTDHHRARVKEENAVQALTSLLAAFYHDITYKSRFLCEVCAVLGQLCNDEDVRELLLGPTEMALDCILHILCASTTGSKLRSKALFAIKQMCVSETAAKLTVGEEAIGIALEELRALHTHHAITVTTATANKDLVGTGGDTSTNNGNHGDTNGKAGHISQESTQAMKLESATNALMLLLLLSTLPQNADIMNKEHIDQVILDLLALEFTETSTTRDRLHQLRSQVQALSGQRQAGGGGNSARRERKERSAPVTASESPTRSRVSFLCRNSDEQELD